MPQKMFFLLEAGERNRVICLARESPISWTTDANAQARSMLTVSTHLCNSSIYTRSQTPQQQTSKHVVAPYMPFRQECHGETHFWYLAGVQIGDELQSTR